jgi:uncharacterized protein
MEKQRHILFFLGHPAHYHLFRPSIQALKQGNYRITIMIKSKDILADLLEADGVEYINALEKGRRDGVFGIGSSLIQKTRTLIRFCKKDRPDLMLGTSAEIAWVGRFMGIPNLNFNEDDVSVVATYARIVYPFATAIISPEACNNGRWASKTLTYKGYQKLAYLHPARFSPNRDVIEKYFHVSEPFSILRFAKLNAHHDTDAQGFTTEVAREAIRIMSRYGKVYITSERELEPEFEPFRLKINPLDIHHLMHFAQLYVGDSQSMAVEAAMLGTPSIRFSSFSGKIGVLEELEHKYKLTVGIKANQPQKLYEKLEEILSNNQAKEHAHAQRERMLNEKEDVTAFFIKLIAEFSSK